MCSLLSYRFYETSEKQWNTAETAVVLLTFGGKFSYAFFMVSDAFVSIFFTFYFSTVMMWLAWLWVMNKSRKKTAELGLLAPTSP